MFAQHFGCTRFVYNWGLALRKEHYERTKKGISYKKLSERLTKELKAQNQWLYDVGSQPLQRALKNLDKAYENFFEGFTRYPVFKCKKDTEFSFNCPENNEVDLDNGLLYIRPQKIKGIKIELHRKFTGTVKEVTISKNPSGKYYASILVDDVFEPLPFKPIEEKTTLGIDTGIKDFLVYSDGRPKTGNKRYLQKSLKKLKHLQRLHAKKQRSSITTSDGRRIKANSANRNKSRIKIARLHEKITNQREDYIHQVTHALTHDNQVGTICIEDLNVSGMIKNHCLARHLSDVGLGKFYTTLAYKCKWNGVNLIRIDRYAPSSKRCSVCGKINRELKLSEREWQCGDCCTAHDRDYNAAVNIKYFGLHDATKKINVDREPVERAPSVPKSVEPHVAITTQQVGMCVKGAGKQKKRRGTVPLKPLRSLASG